MEKGKLVIFSAPSGAGKTTLVQHLLSAGLDLSFSISAASRKKRPNEEHGVDYFFISADEFREKIQRNEFLEWEEVYPDQFYGTLKSEIERIRNNGSHVIFDVDVVGGVNIKKYYGNDALAVFVMPPDAKVLERRLRGRSTEDEKSLQKRLDKAMYELTFAKQFDVIIVNDDLETAKSEALETISKFLN